MSSAAPLRRTIVRGHDVDLAVTREGDPAQPAVLLVHGYPDTGEVWRDVSELLSERFHVARYDVRGAGGSSAPRRIREYRMDRLVDDMRAVIDAVSPDRAVHLVGHDWGSTQGWAAVTDPRLEGRIASFTSISGPGLDHAGAWIRRRLARPSPRAVRELVGQLRRSWYMIAFAIPGSAGLAWRLGAARRWPTALRRLEGIQRPGHPAATLARDAANTSRMYYANVARGVGRARQPRPAQIPVQSLVPLRDAFVSPAFSADLGRHVERLWRRELHAGHWCILSHPEGVSRAVGELVDHVEGAPEARSLRRSRVSGPTTRRARRPKPAPHARFANRLVLVTGAGSGIGRATTLAFAAAGADVIAADIDETSAAATAHEASAHGQTAASMRVDVADLEALERLAEGVLTTHGVPDIVVNNAGIGVAGPFLQTTEAEWQRVLGINLNGVIRGSRLFAEQMVARGEGGHIVNLASAAAYTPSRALPAYSTTKAAVLMLSQCLRGELAPHGIGVSAICPGVIDTPITRATRFVGMSDDEQERARRTSARLYGLRNFGPEKVATAILDAVEHNRALVPVTPEARLSLLLSRLAPSLQLRLGALDPNPRMAGR